MDNERTQRRFESVYSKKVRAGKRRTYFFDVRRTKGDDFYLTLTESTKKFNGEGYERHKIFLYKEDFNRFLTSLEDVINHIKQELMPEYDYDEYTRRHEEYENGMDDEDDEDYEEDDRHERREIRHPRKEEQRSGDQQEKTQEKTQVETEDDMAW